MTVAVIQITSAATLETLRQLRNTTSAGFSSFNGYISPADQAAWWKEMRDRVHGWLYWNHAPATPIGFGLVREENGKYWNSIGVHPDYQGQGFGSLITHDVLVRHGGVVHATVRRNNPAALAMHHAADWEEIEGEDCERLIYLRSRVLSGASPVLRYES